MKSLLRTIALLSALALFSSLVHANQNDDVSQWTQQTLLATLSINYANPDNSATRSYYTYNAWNAIEGFMNGYIDEINTNKLIIHPTILAPSTVVASGVYMGIDYWRVNQTFALPELNIVLAFSVIVIARTPTPGDPYIIQSMNISKQAD